MPGLAAVATYANAVVDLLVFDDRSSLPVPLRAGDGFTASVLRAFRDNPWDSVRQGVDPYRPLATATLLADRAIWGVAPRAFHATTVALHAAASVLVFVVARALLGSRAWIGPLVASVLFAVHPLHSEVVDCAYNRSEILATLGVLGALWLVARASPRDRPRAWLGAGALYAAALCCKESAATLPALLGLWMVLRAPDQPLRERLRAAAPSLAGAGVLASYLALRFGWARYPTAPRPARVLDPEALAQTLAAARDGLRWTLWPDPLCVARVDYPADAVPVAVVVLGALLAVAWRLRARLPVVTYGLLFYVVAFVPSSPLVTRLASAQPVAERYFYLPTAGLAIALAAALGSLSRRVRPAAVLAPAAVLCVLLASITRARNEVWHDEVRLLTANADAQPGSGGALLFLMNTVRYFRGERAVLALCNAHRDEPGLRSAQFYVRCAGEFDARGDADAAEAFHRRAVESEPTEVARYTYARILARRGRIAEADAQYRAALETMTEPARRHTFRGEWLFKCHPEQLAEALAEEDAALAADPRSSIAQDLRRRIAAALGAP